MSPLGLLLAGALAAGAVDDRADVLTAAEAAALSSTLEEARAAGAGDVRVVTLASLDGRPIEEVGLELAESIGIGDETRDDGVLLLIALSDREMRIETGRGVEETLTDARCFEITRKVMRPRFRDEDYAGGIRDGVAAILETLGAPTVGSDEPEAAAGAASSFEVRWPRWWWWAAFAALLVGGLIAHGVGAPKFLPWLLFGLAFPLLPAVHLLGSDRPLDLAAGACFALAAAIWAAQCERLSPLRERCGAALEWSFDRAWSAPLGHLFAFPLWVGREALFPKPYGYGYWVRIDGFRHQNENDRRWTHAGWWVAFVGWVLAVLGTGVTGLGLVVGLLLVALPLHGLVVGARSWLATDFAGGGRASRGTSSGSTSSWRDDHDWSSSSSSSSSSSGGGAFDGGGASDDW